MTEVVTEIVAEKVGNIEKHEKERIKLNRQKREAEIIHYLPLVKQAINKVTVKSTEFDQEDLFNIGVIGLMDAMKRYEVKKDASFENYATKRIRGAIYDEIRRMSRLSRYKMDQVNDFYEVKRKLEQDLKREVTAQEIRQKMGISKKEINDIYAGIHFLSPISLETSPYGKNGDEPTIKEMLVDKNIQTSDKYLIEKEQQRFLIEAFTSLSEREQIVLNLHYQENMSLKEISKMLRISQARASQIHRRVISKLRRKLGDGVK